MTKIESGIKSHSFCSGLAPKREGASFIVIRIAFRQNLYAPGVMRIDSSIIIIQKPHFRHLDQQ